MPGKEIKRISDIGSMQMPAQNHFDLLLDETIDRSRRARHGDVEDTIVTGCKLMVGDNDADLVVGQPGKNLPAMPELIEIEPAIRNAAAWRGGIETNQHRIADM
jgi:hypothetical protein